MNRMDFLGHPHTHQPGPRRSPCHLFRPGRFAALACAVTAGLGLSACVVPPERPALRVEPSYRLQHAGAGLAQGYALLAQRYEGEARWHDALQAWLKAVQAAPEDADLHNALGQAQAGQGDHEAAVETLRRAVQLAPDQASLHNNLGYALMRAGRMEEARAALEQAMALQPGYARAEANLRRLDAPAMAHPSPSAAPAPVTIAVPARSVQVASAPEATAARRAPAVEIANGNGVEGMAACVADILRSRGAVEKTRLRNALPFDTAATVVRYRTGHDQAAQALASQLPGSVPALAGLDRSDSLDLRIVLGHDLRTSGPCARRS